MFRQELDHVLVWVLHEAHDLLCLRWRQKTCLLGIFKQRPVDFGECRQFNARLGQDLTASLVAVNDDSRVGDCTAESGYGGQPGPGITGCFGHQICNMKERLAV